MIINLKQILNTAALVPACLLFSGSSAMAENCTASPSCSSLGYTQSASDCPDGGIKCPFDTSNYYCPPKKAPDCPNGFYKNCEAIHNYWKNDTSKTTTTLADGTKCYQCRNIDCTDYSYLNNMPSKSVIGTGCNKKTYNSCSSIAVGVPSSSGTEFLLCYKCTNNRYGSGRGTLVACSKTYCCGTSDISCSLAETGIGGCMPY